jgi:hypothetical protein
MRARERERERERERMDSSLMAYETVKHVIREPRTSHGHQGRKREAKPEFGNIILNSVSAIINDLMMRIKKYSILHGTIHERRRLA